MSWKYWFVVFVSQCMLLLFSSVWFLTQHVITYARGCRTLDKVDSSGEAFPSVSDYLMKLPSIHSTVDSGDYVRRNNEGSVLWNGASRMERLFSRNEKTFRDEYERLREYIFGKLLRWN